VAIASMKAKKFGLYSAGAVIGIGLAYLLAIPPFSARGPVDSSKGSANRADARGRGALPAPVTAANVIASDMPVILTAPGTVEPFANVAVKTRVDGQIVEVLFKEGDLVNENDVLFRLDDRLMKAQIAQAEASIAKDQASLRDAEATLARREALIGKKIVSEASVDQARYAAEGLKASIAAGMAMLDTQKTQLDYLTIRAPITGRTGSLTSKVGAMVRGVDAAAALVVINQTKPIWVSFAVPQTELGALRRALENKALADITVRGARPSVVSGTIAFVDNQVDKQTGTITAKVIAENADEILWPGLSAEVALTVETRRGMLAVPATAVLPAQQGMITWVIGPDNKVAPRTVTVARIVGRTAYLSDGVTEGERVVTDGQIRLAPGATVTVEQPRRLPANPPASEERRLNGRG
jgi:membrane fusion protein, multidrug efflux system